MAFVGTMWAARSAIGDIAVYCSKCKNPVTVKFLKKEGDFTHKCCCGTTVYKMHLKDEGHPHDYYSKTFIPQEKYNKEFAKKTDIEKMGFETIKKGNMVTLVKTGALL